jgi:hypothetical protein
MTDKGKEQAKKAPEEDKGATPQPDNAEKDKNAKKDVKKVDAKDRASDAPATKPEDDIKNYKLKEGDYSINIKILEATELVPK